ncbi:MAG: Crp/Fnr family transcriptional regulator [Pseudomonas sp.]|nr:MAG: Crp/Fnr family transcriptional regulator [Pseudomonas sp.]
MDEIDRSHLLAEAKEVPLTLSQVLWEPDKPMTHVYFPSRGIVSLIATGEAQAGLEVAMIGREGMLGIQAVLDCESSPFFARVQSHGRAWQVPTDVFQHHIASHPATKRLLNRYAAFRLHQLANLAQCLQSHNLERRLARWLLMNQDRADSNQCRVTQDVLGSLLGVRRASVTVAAGALQDRGVIAYDRGNLQILDRKALEHAACNCYFGDLDTYAVLFDKHHSRR